MVRSTRKSISARKRAACFRDNGGTCHICTRKIAIGESWHVEHVQALGLQGEDSPKNWKPAHVDCHAGKTRKDRAIMADADRALLKHCGLDKERKRSKWPKRRVSA